MKTLCMFAAALFLIVGCGGGGGNSVSEIATEPEAPKATDIWEGIADVPGGSEHLTTCIVAPWGEIRCYNDEGQVLYGNGSYDDAGAFKAAVVWADSLDRENTRDEPPSAKTRALAQKPNLPRSGKGELACSFIPHQLLTCKLTTDARTGGFSSGMLTLFHKHLDPVLHNCFIKDSVHDNAVMGFWAPKDEKGPAFSIDKLHRLFGQDPETGCVFTGEVRRYKDDVANAENPLALHKVRLVVDGCLDPDYVEFNGKRLNGIAYLDATGLRHDTLVMALTIRGTDGGYAAVGKKYRRQ